MGRTSCLHEKVADFNPKKYIEFVDNHQPVTRLRTTENTPQVSKRWWIPGDEKIDFIKNHKMYLDESKQSEWDEVHAKELDLKIKSLPEKDFRHW